MDTNPQYAPKPEPGRDAYTSLQAIAARAKVLSGDDTPGLFDDLAAFLGQKGYRKFAKLAEGEKGLTLETTQGQVIRIQRLEHNEGRVLVHEQLQKIEEGEYKATFHYEILPKVNTKVSEEDEGAFTFHLVRKGYRAYHAEAHKGDLGYLPDGTVIGVDPEAVLLEGKAKVTPADGKWLLKKSKPDQHSIFNYLPEDSISKQEHFFPALCDGRVRGVLSDDDIDRLQHGGLELLKQEKPECFTGISLKNVAEFIELVKDQGWYPSQAHAIMLEHGTLDAGPDAPHRPPTSAHRRPSGAGISR